MRRMLIIEDDDNLCRGIAFAFEKEGYTVICASTVWDGLKKYEQHDIDMIILDLGLPDGSGMELCKIVREKSNIPIIMLTARDMETDEVSGLLAGADDFITKPFSLSVLRARVETIFRRIESNANQIVESGKYRLDTNLCKFYHGNEEISVSATEYPSSIAACLRRISSETKIPSLHRLSNHQLLASQHT